MAAHYNLPVWLDRDCTCIVEKCVEVDSCVAIIGECEVEISRCCLCRKAGG